MNCVGVWRIFLSLSFVAVCFSQQYQGNRGQQYQRNRKRYQILKGPHVCGGNINPNCCPGWQQRSSLGLCIVPICRFPCGSGACARPNMCRCPNGSFRPQCSGVPGQRCSILCFNGGRCKDDVCSCKPGFTGRFCETPICTEPCLNGGRCVGPDKCACPYGFTGNRCQADYRTGPCYTVVRNRMCHNQLIGIVCTRALCCATIGRAWGNPCERCAPKPVPCDRGFLPNFRSRACQDVDECKAIPKVCGGGICVNTVGSYRCECGRGKKMNPTTNRCEDVDECQTISNICANGRCINTEGGYRCECPAKGFTLSQDGMYCIETTPGICYKEIINGYCHRGSRLSTTKAACCCSMMNAKAWGEDCDRCPAKKTPEYNKLCGMGPSAKPPVINECLMNPDLCPNGRCNDTTNGYTCVCNDGYVLAVKRDNKCVDKNECSKDSTLCRNGRCINTVGSYRCQCNSGYRTATSGKRCIDINECTEESVCFNGNCVNNIGSFTCICKRGFTLSLNRSRCDDTNECLNEDVCRNGRCQNIGGAFRCICNKGYELSNDRRNCVDINECNKPGLMCRNGVCENVAGSYRCVCHSGFAATAEENRCADINECQTIRDVCMNGRCANEQGDYQCVCNSGYAPSSDGHRCVDTRRARCFSKYLNGRCSGPLIKVLTVSECCCGMENGGRRGWDSCTPCPLKGSAEYKRVCCKGQGVACDGKDIDECQNNVGMKKTLCVNGKCRNTNGDFTCECNSGFRSDSTGKICTDINECLENPKLCKGGTCKNLPGTFQCKCSRGFVFNPTSKMCDDIDECLSPDQCVYGTCVNTRGNFTCNCPRGLTLDPSGRICRDTRTALCWTRIVNTYCEQSIDGAVSREVCCQSLGKAWGSPCEVCPGIIQKCNPGYAIQDQPTCTDVDECTIYPGLCSNGICKNTPGSYRCECSAGLTLDPIKNSCIDLRKDVCYKSVTSGSCEKPFGRGTYRKDDCCCSAVGAAAWGNPCQECPLQNTDGFKALCGTSTPGFKVTQTAKGPLVGDINECSTWEGLCRNGECVNRQGTFECRCNQGYGLSANGMDCEDIDECSISDGLCGNGTCTNIPGSFRCDCNRGFRNAPMMMEICIDIDECQQSPCSDGRCVNTIGSYKCICPDGMELMKDGVSCEDKNECSDPNICLHGRCENFNGGYQCICNIGFQSTSNMKDCVDIDECAVEKGQCAEVCNNTLGSYVCQCNAGFVLQPDGRTCGDINECREIPEICGAGNTCSNINGGYFCTCNPGFKKSVDARSCIDLDECQDDPSLCSNGICRNTPGSFECLCGKGYAIAKGTTVCVDINECAADQHQCSENAQCSNQVGSFTCECKPGFIGDGITCTDVDECTTGIDKCSDSGTCVNTPGSYRCICDDGYTGDGTICRDINECLIQPDLCEHGQCINKAGSYMCDCEIGYLPSPGAKSCQDINECKEFPELCHHGICENLPGMFRCVCDEGFQLTRLGSNCTDVDECSITGMCPNGHCKNEMGTYRCECDEGFTINKKNSGCIDMRRGDCFLETRSNDTCFNPVGPVYRGACCCTVGKAWNSCEFCPKKGTAEYTRLCPGGPGYVPNPNTTVIIDVDECKEVPGICSEGRCTNSIGSFTCTCPQGWRHDLTTGRCVDRNECLEYHHICGLNGECINTPGSYRCECPPGQVLDKESNLCIDVDKRVCYHNAQIGANPVCEIHFSKNLTRNECCCTVGKAYRGDDNNCERCPTRGSPAYAVLCIRIPPPVTPTVIIRGITPYVPPPLVGSTAFTPLIDTGSTESIPTPRDRVTTTPTTVAMPTGPDVDECSLIDELCLYGICINTIGSFRCECHLGYKLKGFTCTDVDECKMNPCINGKCMNTYGSFLCVCPEGFTIDVTGLRCKDMNECGTPGYCEHGKCKNMNGSFTCQCNEGYRISDNKRTCVDVDECVLGRGICGNGTCVNTPGSYRCQCNPGFTLNGGGFCRDIDECATEADVCRNGLCFNTEGSFRCQCISGYTLTADRRNCEDINECTDIPRYCEHGRCSNTIGGARCECVAGYSLNPEGTRCIDVNECDVNPNYCLLGGRCVNTPGSYRCLCNQGYEAFNGGTVCVDVREGFCFDVFDHENSCAKPRGMRLTKSVCCCTLGKGWGDPCELCPEPKSPRFSIICPKGVGIAQNGTDRFEDVNECKIMPKLCKNGVCINNDGSFRCQCKMGYKLDRTGKNCIDKNECQENPGACGNGNCTNIEGSYHCTCPFGYAPGRDSPKCKDVDECRQNRRLCAYRCLNTPGSFKCSCPRGFELSSNQRHCKDINECNRNGKLCPYRCKNFVGGYRCICNPGYTGDGRVCKDIDECASNFNLCKNGRCNNIGGGYMCNCYAGYVRSSDGKRCEDTRKGLCFATVSNGLCEAVTKQMMQVNKRDCCCTAGKAWGISCELCPEKKTQKFDDLCYGSVPATKLNVCEMASGLCKNGKCINITNGYRCMCNIGFKLSMNGLRCYDINECAHTRKVCQFTCRNTVGSYECSCPKGYRVSADKKTCSDVNECTTDTHNCQYRCVNTVGSFKCECPVGYIKNGVTCVDKDECMMTANLCGEGTCVNTPGSYRCSCNRGFTYNPQTKTCRDKNECKDRVQKCQSGCINLIGGFRCGCRPGFTMAYYWNQCIDMNECQSGRRCGRARCVNTLGSYYCGCNQGFALAQSGRSCQDVNECTMGQNPCSYGCNNNRGGFSCACPGGFYPIGGGHCLSSYGEACYECARAKNSGGGGGVPLVDQNQTATRSPIGSQSGSQFQGYQPNQSPGQQRLLADQGRVPYRRPNNGRVIPNQAFNYQQPRRGQQGGYQQQYQQYGNPQQPYRQQKPNNQRQYNYGQSLGQRQYPVSNQSPGGQQLPQQPGSYSYSYSSSSSSYSHPNGRKRRRRSLHRFRKFTIKYNSTTGRPILKLVPVLSSLNGTFRYVIAKGDTTHFKVDYVEGVMYLRARRPLNSGDSYVVWLKGLYHPKPKITPHNSTKEQLKSTKKNTPKSKVKKPSHELGVDEAKKFSLKLIIKVV